MENKDKKQDTDTGVLPKPTATDRTLDLYARGEDNAGGLEKEVKDAESAKKVARKREAEAASNQQFKWCLVQKSKAAGKEYEGLLNAVTSIAQQDVTEIDKTITQYVEQSDKVKTAFTTLIQSLQTVKANLSDVEQTADQVSELLENSSTTAADDELKWLNTYIPDFYNRVRKICGDSGEKNNKQRRPPQQGLADKTNDLADDAFEIAVKVIGISASANVSSLGNLSKNLLANITALNANVLENVTFAQAQKVESQTLLTQMLGRQSTARAEKFRIEHQHKALEEALKFVDEPDCPSDDEINVVTRERLRQIQQEVEDSFGFTENTEARKNPEARENTEVRAENT